MDQKSDCMLTRLSIVSIHSNFSIEGLKNPKHLLCKIFQSFQALYLLECLRLEYQLLNFTFKAFVDRNNAVLLIKVTQNKSN